LPELIASDPDQAPGASYIIPPHLIDQLFDGLQPSAPIKFAAFNSAENMFDPGSNYVIGKDSLAYILALDSKGKATADPISPSPPPQSTTLIPITGEVQETIAEFQSRFNALKGPCVVHDRN
jgi:hypothetical protein